VGNSDDVDSDIRGRHHQRRRALAGVSPITGKSLTIFVRGASNSRQLMNYLSTNL
jgi:hypothetical protein